MPNHESSDDDVQESESPSAPRGRAVLGVALLCLLILAGGLYVILRDGGGSSGDGAATTVTFGPEGDATTIPEPPPGSLPVVGLSLDSGPAGTEVTLQGTSFKVGKEFGPVELTWNSVDGQKLGSVDGPRFSVKLTIPMDADVRPDGHNILIVQRSSGGEILTQSSVPFFVLPEPG